MKKTTTQRTKKALEVSTAIVRSLSKATLDDVGGGGGVPWQSFPYLVCLQ